MDFTTAHVLLCLGLVLGMLGSLELGMWAGRRWSANNPDEAKPTAGTLEAAVFGLMGLIIAFSFNSASNRFDQRRTLIVEETNAVSTAWMRLDLLPAEAQPRLRELFRNYLDARLATYDKLPDVQAAWAEYQRSTAMQRDIWDAATAASAGEGPRDVRLLLLPALNAMFDLSTSRVMAARVHPPSIVFVMLFGLALGSMILAGYDMALARSRSWMHILGYTVIMAVTVYVIMDIEFPRLGLIRVDDFDQLMRDLRQSMG